MKKTKKKGSNTGALNFEKHIILLYQKNKIWVDNTNVFDLSAQVVLQKKNKRIEGMILRDDHTKENDKKIKKN